MKIKNWKEFQHYKDRDPKWIKLYTKLLNDDEWFSLDPKHAKVLVMLWLLASEDPLLDGNLPSVKKIAFRLRMSETSLESTLSSLSHWVEQPASNTLANGYQHASSELETETYKEEREGERASARLAKKGKRPISDEDGPTEKHFALGQQLGVNVGPEWGKFKNYCLAHDKRYANFEAAFRNWIANAPNMKGVSHAVR